MENRCRRRSRVYFAVFNVGINWKSPNAGTSETKPFNPSQDTTQSQI